MFGNDSDRTWEYFGKHDPYFGVLTADQFKSDKLTEDAKEAFFASGRRYVEHICRVISGFGGAPLAPKRALDFGCGVGRITLPLARMSESVVGVDVSEAMLAEARRNSEKQGLTNTTFVRGDDQLTAVTGTFDLVHSFIVFQHIPPRRGEVIVKRLVHMLRDGGIGVLHFTYAFGRGSSLARRLLIGAYQTVPALYGVRNLAKGRPFGEPMMQMNEYSLNRLMRILEEGGCHNIQVRFTETSAFRRPFHGVQIFFRKEASDNGAHC